MKKIIILFSIVLSIPSFALVGGVESNDTEGVRKHVVQLNNNNRHFCTDVVIAPNLILTAAHCFEGNDINNVRYLNSKFIAMPVKIAAVSLHPKWNAVGQYEKAKRNDLALVKLEQPLPEEIVPLKLTNTKQDLQNKVTLVGFGRSVLNNSNSMGVLKQMEVKTAQINENVNELVFTPNGELPKKEHFKIGFVNVNLSQQSGQGACNGDSGGPALIKNNKEIYEIAALSSWSRSYKEGSTCGGLSVYTETSSYKAWITSKAKTWGIQF